MSDNIFRRESIRPSLKRHRRRRKSAISMSSYTGFGDDGEDPMTAMLDDNDVTEDVEISNNEDDDGTSSYRNPGAQRGPGNRKRINEELLLQKINNCKDVIEHVKTKPWKMSRKLAVHQKARMFVEKYEGQLPRGQGYQHRGKQIIKQVSRTLTNWSSLLLPWEMKIKRIESHFGSVVASYFVFLRWLLRISLWLAVFPTCFLMVPELLAGEAHGSSIRKTIPDDELKTAYDLKTIWAAEGVVKYSILFYGYYGNSKTIAGGYRLPLAYLMTNLAAFLYSFIALLKIMVKNSRHKQMSTKGEEFTFTWTVFTEWDYMIGSHDTAVTKHASIATTFKETIMEEQEKVKDEHKWLTLTRRVVANILICLLLGLSTYVIQLFVNRSRELEKRKQNNPNYTAGFWEENELTVVMTLITTIFPPMLEILSPLEKYHPRLSLRLMLGRIFILNLLNLYTLFIALYYKQNDLMAYLATLVKNETFHSNCSLSLPDTTITHITQFVDGSYNVTEAVVDTVMGTTRSPVNMTATVVDTVIDTTSSTVSVTSKPDCVNLTVIPASVKEFCWETMIGQEVFKLTILDTVFVIGQLLLQDVLRTYFVKYCNVLCCWDMEKHFPEYPEFKTAENLLALINNQGVVWLGTFFNPGLPLLNLVKLLALMYIRCWVVLVYTVPEERIFRASRSNNFYYTLLLIMLFLCMLPPLFAIVTVQPSPQCGPFSGQSRMYDVLTDTFRSELSPTANYIIQYVASPGVILPLFVLSGMLIYYLISVTSTLRAANSQLLLQLEIVGLLTVLYRIINVELLDRAKPIPGNQEERTEGRRRVYAIADARRGDRGKSSDRHWKVAKSRLDLKGHRGKAKTLPAAAMSVLDASRRKTQAYSDLPPLSHSTTVADDSSKRQEVTQEFKQQKRTFKDAFKLQKAAFSDVFRSVQHVRLYP